MKKMVQKNTKRLLFIVVLALIFQLLYSNKLDFSKPQELAKTPSWQLPEGWYQAYLLKNGMKVFFLPNSNANSVSQMVWYHVGAKDEDLGRSGLAHLLEHLMFKGTEKFPKGEFSRKIAEVGGQENAFTGQDYTCFYQIVPPEKLEMVMEMESDRMKNLTLTEPEFQTERNVVMEEFRMTMANKPSAKFEQEIDATLHRNHPYSKQVIGWEHEILALKKEDALAFYQRFYDPKNAILVISGNFDVEQMKLVADKFYGAIPADFVESRRRVIEPPRVASAQIEMSDAKVGQPALVEKFIAPSYSEAAAEENLEKSAKQLKKVFALEVLARYLGGDASSVLYKKLVTEKKLAVTAAANFLPYSYGPAEFVISAYPSDEQKIAAVKAEIISEIDKIAAGEVDARRLEAVKKAMLAEQVYEREGVQGLAYLLGSTYSVGLLPDFLQDWGAKISIVSVADVVAAAGEFLRPDVVVVGVLKPKPVPQMQKQAQEGKK